MTHDTRGELEQNPARRPHWEAPADVADTVRALDALAEADRAAAPAWFEQRLFAKIQPAIPLTPPEPVLARLLGGLGSLLSASPRGALAMAACIAVMGGAAYLATLSSPRITPSDDATARLEADMDLFFNVAWGGESLLARQIESVRTDASNLAESLHLDWDPASAAFDLESL